MRNRDQNIDSGGQSTNHQAGRDISITNEYSGLSYSEVKEVAMDIFEKNYLKLGEKVENIVDSRAERVIMDYLERLKEKDPNALINTVDPDVRANIYNAQVAYARSGKEDVGKLLVELLVERTINNDSELNNIILNEALTVITKLTTTQVNLILILFITSNINFTSPTSPDAFSKLLEPFEYMFESQESYYTDLNFLSYLGCLSFSAFNNSIGQMLTDKNIIGFTSRDYNHENLNSYPRIKKFIDFYNYEGRRLVNCNLTPVGEAIGIASFNALHEEAQLPYRFE